MIRGMENTRPMAANGLTQTGALVTHTAHERAIAYACASADVRACEPVNARNMPVTPPPPQPLSSQICPISGAKS